MQFSEINIYQVMIFRLYSFYNKCKMIKIGDQTREKSQVLSSARIILLSTVLSLGLGLNTTRHRNTEQLFNTGLCNNFDVSWPVFIEALLLVSWAKKRRRVASR